MFTSHSLVRRTPAYTGTASCRSSAHNPERNYTETQKKKTEKMSHFNNQKRDSLSGGRDRLVGRDPQRTGTTGAGRRLSVYAAVAQKAALALLTVVPGRVVLAVLMITQEE